MTTLQVVQGQPEQVHFLVQGSKSFPTWKTGKSTPARIPAASFWQNEHSFWLIRIRLKLTWNFKHLGAPGYTYQLKTMLSQFWTHEWVIGNKHIWMFTNLNIRTGLQILPNCWLFTTSWWIKS